MRNIYFTLLLSILLGSTALAQRKMEFLDRGLVAVKVSNGVFLSWRVLGTDPVNIGFNIYRNGTKVNASVIIGASNLTDAAGTVSSSYSVRPVLNGVEQPQGGSCTVWATQGLTVQLQQPAGGTNASGSYTYSPNDCSVGDVDGDGQWELIVKWDPSNSKDNSQSGYTGNVFIDCYKLSGKLLWRIDLGVNIRAGAHYTQFLVGDYDADGKAEIAFKTAPGTRDGSGAYLSKGPAANDDDSKDYRNTNGYILAGPEYLTIFNGETGKEMSTVNYNPARGTVSSWGDNYGNRVDRFLAMNAYLDGIKPSMVFNRGYYTRMAITAYDWDGANLTQRWYYNAATSGQGGYGQGNHNWTCGDVDGDGKDEIIHGSCAIDDNGQLMYRTGLGHGDAIHMGDLDVNNPGLEVWQVHEEKGSPYGYEMHDARTGKILWGGQTGTDVGRGLAADVDANSPGYEMWSSANNNTYSSTGKVLSTARPSYNFRVYWDGDLLDELLDGNKLDKWNGKGSTRLITFTGNSCNGTKSTPNLTADILGDWREEVILHDGASKLYIYTTTIPTEHKMYTLMHDPMYRNAISWQNTAYNQPPHLSFLLGKGIASVPRPNIEMVASSYNAKPDVKITAPANNTKLPFMGAVKIAASATDSDGSIASVLFYNGTTLLGSASAAPYSYTMSNLATGTYVITARATDNAGATSISAAVTVTVSPGTFVYTEAGADKLWATAGNWMPQAVPTSLDTAIIRTGEAQITADIANLVKVEPNGTLRMIGYFNVPAIEMLGGTLKVYTSAATYGLKSVIDVKAASSIMSGSGEASVFTLDGTLKGNADLTKTRMGILQLNANAIGYTGNWTVAEGVLRIGSNKSIGDNTVTVAAAAVLAIAAPDVFITKVDLGTGVLALSQNLEVKQFIINGTALGGGKYTAATHPGVITGNGILTVIGTKDCAGTDGGSAFIDECGTCVGGTTGRHACIQDCNGIWGGTAVLDKCEICVGGATGKVACSSSAQAESACSYDGTVDGNHEGFTGDGFVNFTNAVGSSISFNLYSTTAGTHSFTIIYANGGTASRPMTFTANGVSRVIDFPQSGSWTTWIGQTVTVPLDKGVNNCTLTANNADGGSNLDRFIFFSDVVSFGLCGTDCNGVSGGSARLDNCGTCYGGNTGLEPCEQDCNGDWGGTAFMDDCGKCAAGKTGLYACAAQTVTLVAGWNLISLYVQTDDMRILSLFPNAVEVKTANQYFSGANEAFFNSMTSIEIGKGYYVNNSVYETINLTGVYIQTQLPQLNPGWNLIGCPYLTATPLDKAFGTEIKNIQIIKNFSDLWEQGGSNNTINTLEPGKAYFVK